MNNKYTIKKLLLDVGISPDLSGFHYLVEAINAQEEVRLNGKEKCSLTALYMEIAEKFNNTAPAVERSIRHAVEKAFKSNNILLYKIFNTLIDGKSGKVTVSCFVCTLAEYLIMEENNNNE